MVGLILLDPLGKGHPVHRLWLAPVGRGTDAQSSSFKTYTPPPTLFYYVSNFVATAGAATAPLSWYGPGSSHFIVIFASISAVVIDIFIYLKRGARKGACRSVFYDVKYRCKKIMRSSTDERLFLKYGFVFSTSIYMTATFSNLNRLGVHRRSMLTSSIIVMRLLIKMNYFLIWLLPYLIS